MFFQLEFYGKYFFHFVGALFTRTKIIINKNLIFFEIFCLLSAAEADNIKNGVNNHIFGFILPKVLYIVGSCIAKFEHGGTK